MDPQHPCQPTAGLDFAVSWWLLVVSPAYRWQLALDWYRQIRQNHNCPQHPTTTQPITANNSADSGFWNWNLQQWCVVTSWDSNHMLMVRLCKASLLVHAHCYLDSAIRERRHSWLRHLSPQRKDTKLMCSLPLAHKLKSIWQILRK